MFDINNTDPTQPERLSENSTVLDRLEKFSRIAIELAKEGIQLIEIDSYGCPVLSDSICGFRITHNIITWEIYTVKEVAAMITEARNEFRFNKEINIFEKF